MTNEKLGCALKATEFFTLHSSLSIVLRSSLTIVLRFQYFFQMFLSDRTTGDELRILW